MLQHEMNYQVKFLKKISTNSMPFIEYMVQTQKKKAMSTDIAFF